MDMKVSAESNWHVVYTYPNTEKKVYQELTRRQITVFLPTTKVLRQWSDRKKQLEVPLFPSYVFVKVRFKEMWMVTLVDGVARFVKFNGTPAVISESEIDLIKKVISGTENVHNENDCVVEGDYVQIEHGPLAGLQGRVMTKKGKKRLYLTLISLNKNISVEIEALNLAMITRSVEKHTRF